MNAKDQELPWQSQLKTTLDNLEFIALYNKNPYKATAVKTKCYRCKNG